MHEISSGVCHSNLLATESCVVYCHLKHKCKPDQKVSLNISLTAKNKESETSYGFCSGTEQFPPKMYFVFFFMVNFHWKLTRNECFSVASVNEN